MQPFPSYKSEVIILLFERNVISQYMAQKVPLPGLMQTKPPLDNNNLCTTEPAIWWLQFMRLLISFGLQLSFLTLLKRFG